MTGLFRDEHGAVAVLYSIVIMLMLGMVAVVVELGGLRADRRQTQTTSDLAALAGAFDLVGASDAANHPRLACRTAQAYYLQNTVEAPKALQDDDPIYDACDVFPETLTQSCEEYLAVHPDGRTATSDAVEPYLIAITWPVPDDSEWLTNRHPYDPDVDGVSPCDRMAVQVARTRGFVFGGVFAQTEGHVASPAVARASIESGSEIVPALVVLDPFNCAVLTHGGGAGGTGAIWVFESYSDETGEFGPGLIAVDSDASGSDGSYSCSTHTVIETGGANTQILAGVQDEDRDGQPDVDGTGRALVRDGLIQSYGIQLGRQVKVYVDGDVTSSRLAGGDDAPPLPGNPPQAGSRVLREPWVHRYECRDSYDTVGDLHVETDPCPGITDEGVAEDSRYVSTLRGEVAAASADPAAAGYTVVNQGGGNVCDLAPYVSATDPDLFVVDDSDGVWFDCNLEVKSNTRLIVPRGDVAVMGNLSIQGALAINVRTTITPNVEDSWVYVDGTFDKSGGAALRLGNPSPDTDPGDRGGVFVLLGGPASTSPGQFTMSGGSSSGTGVNVEGTSCDTSWEDAWVAGVLTWTPCHFTWVAPFRDTRFQDLALWSEYTDIHSQPHSISGDVSNLIADGVFYMPNAKFHFSGSGQMGQQRAQFVAYRLQAQGGGALKVLPDPDRARKTSDVVVNLIR